MHSVKPQRNQKTMIHCQTLLYCSPVRIEGKMEQWEFLDLQGPDLMHKHHKHKGICKKKQWRGQRKELTVAHAKRLSTVE